MTNVKLVMGKYARLGRWKTLPQEHSTHRLKNVKRWLVNSWTLGFLASCIFTYVVTNIFMDSLLSHKYEPALSKFMYTPNTYIRCRQEGWATTFVGKYNTFAVIDIDKNELPKIAIWGDSAVEAIQVPDTSKMAQQVTKMFNKAGQQALGVAIAHSGNTLSDYIVDLREYDSLIPNIVAHYIVFSNEEDDTLPNRNIRGGRSKFVHDGRYRIIESDNRRRYQQFYNQLSKYNLRMVSYFFGKVNRYSVRLPWSRQAIAKNEKSLEKKLSYDKIEAWEFIFGELRKQTNKPITLIYAPYMPYIRNKKVCLERPTEREMDLNIIAKICQRHNIGFIDLTDDFNVFFLKTMKFPRGFANSFPGQGHFNVHGHQIVAKAIFSNEIRNNLKKQ